MSRNTEDGVRWGEAYVASPCSCSEECGTEKVQSFPGRRLLHEAGRKPQSVKHFNEIVLSQHQSQALTELQRRLGDAFDIETLVLYGSVARGEAEEESDLDVLVVTAEPLPRPVRHQITDLVFDINLRYDTNISTLVVDRAAWETGCSVLLIREEILRDGVPYQATSQGA